MKLLPFESEIGKQFREVIKGNNFMTHKEYTQLENLLNKMEI